MNRVVIVTVILLSSLRSTIVSNSEITRELAQLRTDRDKAAAAAMEPINRRYQSSLEQLLKKATQSNDLENAIRIREELQKLGVTVQATPASPTDPKDKFAARLVNTSWVWWNDQTITFQNDGKAVWSAGRDPWTWKAVNAGRRTIEIRTATGKTIQMLIDAELSSGTIEGDNQPRPTRKVAGGS